MFAHVFRIVWEIKSTCRFTFTFQFRSFLSESFFLTKYLFCDHVRHMHILHMFSGRNVRHVYVRENVGEQGSMGDEWKLKLSDMCSMCSSASMRRGSKF